MHKQHTPDEFWTKTTQRADGCWIWAGGRTSGGRYGNAYYNGRYHLAHRLAYTLAYGPIPDGMSVCHTCDVTLCCNPDHLWAGTHAENLADMAVKGRAIKKITDDDVRQIRALWRDGMNGRELGERFGIADSVARRVAQGKVRQHVK